MTRWKMIVAVASVASLGSVATAGGFYSASYSWDNGGTVLGSYGSNVTFTNVDDPLGGGGNALEIHEEPLSGTPQGYISWITGLTDGDTIDVSMLGLGDGSETSKVRLWAHYTLDDITSYGGSSSGPSGYSSSTTEWTLLSHQWTFDSNGGARNGIVIEARIYSYSSNELTSAWVTDLNVEVESTSDSVSIMFPVAIPAPGALAMLGLAGLAGRGRRRRN